MKKKYLLLLILIFILSLLFLSCQGIAPTPPPSEGEGEEEPSEEPTGRVVLMELFNVDGCPASRVLNPLVEEVAEEYTTDEVILVELKGWLKGATSETMERFSWYVPEDKHVPFIAFNGLSDTFSEGVSGGGGGGGGGTPTNHAPVIISEPNTTAIVEEEYIYDVEATDADNDPLTYSLVTSPEGMSLESETGIITWTPTSEQVEEHNVLLEVSDGNKNATQDFIITVYDETNFLITEIYAYAITNQVTDSKLLEKKIEYLKSEDKIKDSYQINKPLLSTRGSTEHFIQLEWVNLFPEANGYKIYKKNDGLKGFELLYDWNNFPAEADYLGYNDYNVSEGNSYAYYVTAYNIEPEWETLPSNEVVIDTWLPPCSLVNPENESVVNEHNPDFTWDPVGLNLEDFPYNNSIESGKSDLWIYDNTSETTVWWHYFDNMTTNSATYNDDDRAAPLISGHNYDWESWGYGFDENEKLIAMSWSEGWHFTVELESSPSPLRRALLVGVGDYMYGDSDLQAPPYDVDMMHDTLSHSGDGFVLINELKDWHATKEAILNGISSTFSDADSDDISYFYFSGHGTKNHDGTSYLVPTDAEDLNDCISVNELEAALSEIQGTKVVFLDSCHSGGFIGKEINMRDVSDFSKNFNDNIISTFMAKDSFERDLAKPQYQVLTSCYSWQSCYELWPEGEDPFGLFSRVLCEGCGYDYYNHPYNADSNANGEVTLHEAYFYTDQEVSSIIDYLNTEYDWDVEQDTQVYPENSYFVIIEEYIE